MGAQILQFQTHEQRVLRRVLHELNVAKESGLLDNDLINAVLESNEMDYEKARQS